MNCSAKDEFLLALLRQSLNGGESGKLTEKEAEDVASCNWSALLQRAAKHGILSLLYEPIKELSVPQPIFRRCEQAARSIVRQNYRLWTLTGQIYERMKEKGIPVVLLKGMGTAAMYPVPELRKSGDIDFLLLEQDKLEEAEEVLHSLGCVLEERQPSLHHVVYGIHVDTAASRAADGEKKSADGKAKIEVELHTMLAEPFDNEKVNELLRRQVKECKEHSAEVEIAGIRVRTLDTAYHAYELLLHMLQHFLRSGFGLKLLCDWVVFWNREFPEDEKKCYLELTEGCGIKKFSDLVTLTCVQYLGLDEARVEFMELDKKLSPEEFLREIMEAEEFGKSAKDRMVALRGNGLGDYAREFHHQMHLNYPKAGKCILFWPVLWALTLVRFLVNNRRIRKTSLKAILKKAGQRGAIIKKLHLFQ